MAQESFSQDIQDLWAIYQNTKAQLEQVQTVKTQVLTALASISSTPGAAGDDFKSYSRGGLDGNESWTRSSLLDRFEVLTNEEARLSELMREQRLLAIKASPGFITTRTNLCGLRNF